MAHQYARPFYDSLAWKRCRASYIQKRIKIDGGLCEACHLRIGYIVHHKTMIDETNVNDVEVTLNHDNLQFVCKACHDRMENHFVRSSSTKVRYEFDQFGQPIVAVSEEPSEKSEGWARPIVNV